MWNSIKITLQYFLPKIWLTEFIGWIANKKLGYLTQFAIYIFVWMYKIDMNEAKYTNLSSYSTFNEFFVRALRDGVRQINTDKKVLISSVDGIISQFGVIEGDKIIQAKGYYYTLESLLCGNRSVISNFINGNFVTTYLAPQNYHRIHMPYGGKLVEMIYVPGSLFSVNSLTTSKIPNLFSKNERVICLFDTDLGLIAQILVGSIITGSIETIWEKNVSLPREGIIKYWDYQKENRSITLLKGQEIGRFNLGSTVINLFSNNILLSENLSIKKPIYVGQKLAYGK